MNNKFFVGRAIWLLLIIAALTTSSCKTNQNGKPNIIVLLVDDAGYADFGFMGCEDLQTPNIDNLASRGVVFTDAHVSASVCGPSRAGLITGRYQQRFGFECNPGDGAVLDSKEQTIAATLKKAGYTTAAFGKWHLGAKPGYRPTERGFDYYWGFLAGGRSYFPNPRQDVEGNTRAITENTTHVTFDGYLTDRLGEKAVDFIDRNKDNPFFIYWAPNAVHTPMEATEEDLKKFEGHPRQQLAAMTWALDRAVGNIVDKLEQEKLLDNTLIFFLSDNGGAHNNQSSCLPLKGWKGNEFEGGLRVAFFATWASKLKGGREFDGLSSSMDIFATSADAAGILEQCEGLDGVSLLPYLTGETEGEPHSELFWRKDQKAAARINDHKLIRVEQLPSVMYNLSEDISETNNLVDKNLEKLNELETKLSEWEKELMDPLWTEGHTWDTITWMIHQDLMNNREVRVKDPAQLKEYLSNKN
ncbi:sulfatase-like hydrolase/transferase [Prolixibacteraceae bacterium Z1-6]|uniref:Sulfatase-like hydrolase/transferase n=1 Tax=Draconibacterium aestuarii TaxID=2998507 RepID=A0A9X3J6U5_9BACT|nr:sulfatase-like hydrolase/transferase [Prolixibacteraceae bacterium Z1-6]